MTTRPRQIERLLASNLVLPSKEISELAEKIAALFEDDGAALTATATLENEVTSTLMDMTVATVLATLIEEEGGGRANVSISPMSMDHMAQHYTYSVESDGMVRTVRIALRPDSDLNDSNAWREPSNRHSLVRRGEEDVSRTLDQAEPRERDRPLWAVSYFEEGATYATLLRCHDRADAERQCKSIDSGMLPEVQNRFCLHPWCASSACSA